MGVNWITQNRLAAIVRSRLSLKVGESNRSRRVAPRSVRVSGHRPLDPPVITTLFINPCREGDLGSEPFTVTTCSAARRLGRAH
jgi:hypothetical protein